jgi:hypothetical protein
MSNVTDSEGSWRLVVVGNLQGRLDDLRMREENGDRDAAKRLADLMAPERKLGELLVRARKDDDAAKEIAEIHGQEKRLDSRLARGDTFNYFDLLAKFGRRNELQIRADSGEDHASYFLAHLLAIQDLDALRTRAAEGDVHAARRLPGALAQAGLLDELRDLADSGNNDAVSTLDQELVRHGQVDELRSRADSGDQYAAEKLARVLADAGNLGELRDRARHGDRAAAKALYAALGRGGHLEELRVYANLGDRCARDELIHALPRHLDWEVVRALALSGDQYASDAIEYWRTRPARGIEHHIVPIVEWVALTAASGVVGGFASDSIKALHRKFARRERRTGANVHEPVTETESRMLARATALTWYKSQMIAADKIGSITVVLNQRRDGLTTLTVVDSTGRRLAVQITAEGAAPAVVDVEVMEDS